MYAEVISEAKTLLPPTFHETTDNTRRSAVQDHTPASLSVTSSNLNRVRHTTYDRVEHFRYNPMQPL